MPPNPERRIVILDAAIDILVDLGVGGVTHRQVDERAGLPSGTTSNYFRTRLALLEATASRTVDLQWRFVEQVQAVLPSPLTRTAVIDLMARLLSADDEQARRRNIARFELFMEGTRRPELRPFLTQLQHAAMKTAGLILSSAGIDASPEQVDELTRMLNGLAFSNLTIDAPDHRDLPDPAATAARVLRSVLGD